MSEAKSYTQWSTFHECSRRYSLRYVQKIEPAGPKHEAATRGTDLHNAVEQYFAREVETLPPELLKYGQRFMGMRSQYEPIPELKFCVNKDWGVVDWDAEDGYLRGVIDLIFLQNDKHIEVYEWKSGREWPDHVEQRNLYGFIALLLYPEHETCRVNNFYFDLNKEVDSLYTRSALLMYKDVWEQRLASLEAGPYIPSPGFYCTWCPYSKDAGGPCEF